MPITTGYFNDVVFSYEPATPPTKEEQNTKLRGLALDGLIKELHDIGDAARRNGTESHALAMRATSMASRLRQLKPLLPPAPTGNSKRKR